MKLQDAARLFVNLFQGREGCYALKTVNAENKKFYAPARLPNGEDAEFTPMVAMSHITGDVGVGIYPLRPDNTVYWACADFDGKRGDPLRDAVVVQEALLKRYGVYSWLECSQGGSGVHLWVFFDRPVEAWRVRSMFSVTIPEYSTPLKDRVSSFDRVLPHQDKTNDGGYGNLCALPLNGPDLVADGRTVFISPDGTVEKDQWDVLRAAFDKRNLVEVVLEATKDLTPVESSAPVRLKPRQSLAGGGRLLSAYGCNWLKDAYKRADSLAEPEWHAAISQFAQLEVGQDLAHKFSQPYAQYNANETQRKFEYAVNANKPHTIEYVRENFGECPGGCVCEKFGLRAPYQLAKVPISKLVERSSSKMLTSTELADKAMQIVREVASGQRFGFPWGYDLLDDKTELRGGDLIVVAARRSIGKTAIMIDASVRGARMGVPQYIMSLEMTSEQIGLRYLARLGEVDHTLITTGKLSDKDMQTVEKAYEELCSLPLFIDDARKDVDHMLDTLGDLVFHHGPGPVWIDFLQLVELQKGEQQKQAVDRVVTSYKSLAKILNVPVVALAQLNRSEESYEGDDDLDAWLKDSGRIEEVADVILYIRGKRLPGVVARKWILHKERHRAAYIHFRSDFHQHIYKFDMQSPWSRDDDKEFKLVGEEYDESEDDTNEEG